MNTAVTIFKLLKLSHNVQHDPPVPLREAAHFAQHGACSLVTQRLHQLVVEKRQVVRRP